LNSLGINLTIVEEMEGGKYLNLFQCFDRVVAIHVMSSSDTVELLNNCWTVAIHDIFIMLI
jgi:hypothetical protein